MFQKQLMVYSMVEQQQQELGILATALVQARWTCLPGFH
jgi:hypothetical protein